MPTPSLTSNQVQFTVCTLSQYNYSTKDASTFYYVVENEASPNTGSVGELYIGSHLIGSGLTISDVITYLTTNETIFPLLTSGDILPKNYEVERTRTIFGASTTAGDTDVKSGTGSLLSIRGTLVDSSTGGIATVGISGGALSPTIGTKYVSTGMNLIDEDYYLRGFTVDTTSMTIQPSLRQENIYFFPVSKGTFGTYGTSEQNNGYIVVNPEGIGILEVYLSDVCPANAFAGERVDVEEVDVHLAEGKRYYLPSHPGWLLLLVTQTLTFETVGGSTFVYGSGGQQVGCHVAWSNYKDDECGTSNKSTVRFGNLDYHYTHSWGMAGIVGAGRQVYDEIVLDESNSTATYINRLDRIDIRSIDWVPVGSNTYKGTIWGMKPDGLWTVDPNNKLKSASLDGNELVVKWNVSGVPAYDGYVYYELESQTETTDVLVGSVSYNDFGTTYIIAEEGRYDFGRIPDTLSTAIVTERFQQYGRDQLFNAVDHLSVVEEVVATALCELNGRVGTIEDKITNGFDYLKVEELESNSIVSEHIQVQDIDILGDMNILGDINIPQWNDF